MPAELTKQIREILNHPWKKEILLENKVGWNKIWASLDTFDDTIEAISYYERLESFDAFNGGYLLIYGVLQALNLQQDAINNLYKALFNESINWKTNYPTLYQIREHRNNSVGHPTNRSNDSSFHMIARNSIQKEGFKLASYFPKTGKQSKFEDISIVKCISSQRILLKEILLETMKNLEKELEFHKNKFKGEKLSSVIPNDFHYHITKLYEHAFGNYEIVELNFKVITETITNIKNGIEKRYFKVQALQGVEDTIDQIDYILERLKRTLIENKINDQFELRIFIKALNDLSDELFEMIVEIDDEFESQL